MRILVGVLSMLFSAASIAGSLVTFSPGDPIRSSDINANFNELANRNAGVDARVSTLEGGGGGACSGNDGPLHIASAGGVSLSSGRPALSAACQALDARATVCSVDRVRKAISERGLVFDASFVGGALDQGAATMFSSYRGGGGGSTDTTSVSLASSDGAAAGFSPVLMASSQLQTFQQSIANCSGFTAGGSVWVMSSGGNISVGNCATTTIVCCY